MIKFFLAPVISVATGLKFKHLCILFTALHHLAPASQRLLTCKKHRLWSRQSWLQVLVLPLLAWWPQWSCRSTLRSVSVNQNNVFNNSTRRTACPSAILRPCLPPSLCTLGLLGRSCPLCLPDWLASSFKMVLNTPPSEIVGGPGGQRVGGGPAPPSPPPLWLAWEALGDGLLSGSCSEDYVNLVPFCILTSSIWSGTK